MLSHDIECVRRKKIKHDIVEGVRLEMILKHKIILLAVIYRPPHDHTVSYIARLSHMEEAISTDS